MSNIDGMRQLANIELESLAEISGLPEMSHYMLGLISMIGEVQLDADIQGSFDTTHMAAITDACLQLAAFFDKYAEGKRPYKISAYVAEKRRAFLNAAFDGMEKAELMMAESEKPDKGELN